MIVEEGVLEGEDASVERLAARLGVTGRHLRRLFTRHCGATPSAVARTARVQRAKRLLSETSLPMAEVALQAGFGNLRSFNAGFAQTYRRPPSEIRRSPGAAPQPPP